MVIIEYISGNTFKINNKTLIRNFHSYVSGNNIRIVNAYDTRDELLPYTNFSEFTINGDTFASAIDLVEVLTPILFIKSNGEGGGGVTVLSGNIITRTVPVYIDWSSEINQQVVDHVNAQEFSVTGSQRILFKAVRIIGDVEASNASEFYYWEFKPGKGNYGVNGTPITLDDIELISIVTNSQNNVIDLGEIGTTPIEIYVNSNGPYSINSAALNVFKALRQGSAVNYIYVGTAKNIGDGETQTSELDYIDVNSEPVNPPTSTGGLDIPLIDDYIPVSRADGSIVWEPKPTGGSGSSYTPPSDYNDVAALFADQTNQVENEEYTVKDASGWSTITHSGWATFKKKAASTADESDYDLREQQDFDSAPETFTATQNQYGTHPAFLSQNEAIIWLLQNGGGTANPELFEEVTYDTQDATFRSFYEAGGLVTSASVYYNGATYVAGVLNSANNYAPVIVKHGADDSITYNNNIGTIDNNDPLQHNYPAIIVKDGFIYIAEVNGHGDDIKIWKSNTIENISAWTLHHTLVGPFGYCNMRNLPSGRVIIYSRATNVSGYPSFTGEEYSSLYALSDVDDLTNWTLLNGTERGAIEIRHYNAPFYHYGVNEYTYAGINLRHSSPSALYFAQAMWKTKDQFTYKDLAETTSKNLTTSLFSAAEVEDKLTIVGSNTDTRTFRGGLGGVVVNDTVYCSYFDAENTEWKFRKIFRDGTIRDYPCNLTELPTTGLNTNAIDYIRFFYNGTNLVVVTNDANFIKVHACDLNFGNLQFIKTLFNKNTSEGVGGSILPFNLDEITGNYIIGGDGTGEDTLMRYIRSNTVFDITVPDYTDFEIIRPTASEVYNQGKDIVIALNLNGSDENITKVEYLYGTTLIAEVTTAPFDSYRWTNPPVGADTLTIKTYKNGTLFQTKTVDYEVQAGLTTADAISYWRFEETASPFADSVGTNTASLTAGGAVSTATGKIGRGIKFLGADQLVEVPHNDNLSFTDGLGNGTNSDIPFSIETWVKFSNVGVTGTIIEKMIAGGASEYRLIHLGGSNTILFGLYDSTDTNRLKLTAPFNAVQDQWYHIVVTYDGSGTVAGLNFIIDGVAPTMTKTVDGTYNGTKITAATLCFGNSSNLSLDLSGTIDEPVFWNKELSLQEAQDRYNNGNGAILN